MIELRGRPRHGRVARFASLRETLLRMIWIRCVLEVLQVASHTRRRLQSVVVVHVAVHALTRWHGVATSQREASQRMIKICVRPAVGRVARFAGGDKLGGDVIGVLGALEILLVAAVARR